MRPGEPLGAELSLPELMHQLTDQTTTLIRQELALVRAEIAQKGKFAGESAGLFAAGSLLGIGAFGALTIMFIGLISYLVPLWAAALAVAAIYGSIAAACALAGKKKLEEMQSVVPTRAVDSMRQDAQAVRRGVEHGR